MAFVLDASIAACWCFEDESAETADAAMARLLDEEAVVPSIWPLEIRNILIVNERRGRIDETGSDRFLRNLRRMPIRTQPGSAEDTLMALARTHRLTAYDAAYLQLAIQTKCPVATLDSALAQAVRREGLPLVRA